MISFLHTADVHLDAPFFSLSSRFEQRQADFRATLQRIRDLAVEKRVDFWLIAGDLLEHHGGKRSTALFLQQLFASVDPIPVFIAPGNHDPWTEDSFYQTLDWPSNVIFFTPEWGIYEFPEKSSVVYGWGFPHAHVNESPLRTFPGKLAGYQYHLMVLHGTVEAGQDLGHQPYAPLPLADLAAAEMDYIALGHIHKPSQFVHPVQKKVFAAYPGTPEGLTAKEEGERGVLYGELKPTGELRLQTISIQTRQIRKLEMGLEGVETMEDLIGRLEARLSGEDPNDLVYVTFVGERASHFTPAIDLLQSRFSQFFFLQFHDKTWPDVDEEKLLAEGGVWGRWLSALAAAEETAADETSREIARLARKEALKRIGGSLR